MSGEYLCAAKAAMDPTAAFRSLFMTELGRKTIPDRSSKCRKKNRDRKRENVAVSDRAVSPHAATNANIYIELEPNVSKFAIFASIRAACLESETKQTMHHVTSASSSRHSSLHAPSLSTGKLSNIENDTDCDSESDESTEKEIMQRVPQIVGAGLRSLFELIADARNSHPNLCGKALKALLDVIQGQHPESFRTEPHELIHPLFILLLDLATLYGNTSCERFDATNWSNIGCSALLGLCIARGDTGQMLRAVAAMLMSPKLLAGQSIHLPTALSALQRSVHAAALGKPNKPDFFKNGLPHNSLIDHFSIRTQIPLNLQCSFPPSIASDGKYLYILIAKALLKIGSGFNSTLKSYVYGMNLDFSKEKCGWIGFCNNVLYYKRISKRSTESILVVNTETLTITGAAQVQIPSTRDGQNCVLFSDGDSINAICTTHDDSLIVKQILSTSNNVFHLPLKLAKKNFRIFGYSIFEEECLNQNQMQKIQSSYNYFEPKLPNDTEIMGLSSGKEFGLLRSANGKVFYYGKSTSLGLKSVGKSASMKINELIISKISNIVQIAIGHDGIHALLVNDDGSVYFVGTARRGEDGDNSKNRRQPKAVKPKKILKIDGHFVVNVSCNNGTSAFVTKNGKLIMFGKDTTHCDSSGNVYDLQDQHITKVALGKAHCVALNSKGHLFTFGLNNKGQCGRVFVKSKDGESAISMETSEIKSFDPKYKVDVTNMCDSDDHTVVQGQCRVCSICRECSGYNVSCVTTLNLPLNERVPGAFCACGNGDAGCSKCGACSTCISFQENESLRDASLDCGNYDLRLRSKGLIYRKYDKKVVNTDDNLPGSDIDRDTPRVAPLPPQRINLPTTSPVVQICCGLHHTVVLTLAGEVFTFGSNQYGQLGTGDLQPVSGPTQIKVAGLISQVAAGANHTVLLTYKGVVYTFGNYQKGQLGRLPKDIQAIDDSSVAATVNASGTEGSSDRKHQNAAEIFLQRQSFLWNCSPGPVIGIGPSCGKRATWIAASGDQTYVKVDDSLVTGAMLSKVNVVADKNTIMLIPNSPLSFQLLAINRRDGTCNIHAKNQMDFSRMGYSHNSTVEHFASDKCNQNIDLKSSKMTQSMHEGRAQFLDSHDNVQEATSPSKLNMMKNLERGSSQLAFTMDTCYGVLWVFDGISKRIFCYNIISSELKRASEGLDFKSILSPELALPMRNEIQVTRCQAALNLLACLDILTSTLDSIPLCFETVTPQVVSTTKDQQSTDYQSVSRFENFGGGWGYSGHSIEALRFMVDTDIILGGFGMYGGRGEYTCKLKLYDLGPEGGAYEKEGVILSETEDIPYECAVRSKFNIMLTKSVTAHAGRWYLVCAKISGPASDCGSNGQSSVTTEDQVVFTFKSSKKSNNGTDENSGQIPSIVYRIINQEIKPMSLPADIEPIHKISLSFATSVSKECFDSLVLLLNWSWGSFKVALNELKDKKKICQTKSSLDRLVYINKSCLRLLRKYIDEIYPADVQKSDNGRPIQKKDAPENEEKTLGNILFLANQGPSTSKTGVALSKSAILSSMDSNTPTNVKKINFENIQLAECIGDVRALLTQVLCDEMPQDIELFGGLDLAMEVIDECHRTFVACFDAFYPTSSLKWNCLCDLLGQMDKRVLHSRLLSAILAGLCNPSVKLRSTFSLLTPNKDIKSIISPSDNSGLPMLLSSENHQYPVLIEQMIHRSQQEKNDVFSDSWSFKDVFIRLLDIIAYPIKSKLEGIYNDLHGNYSTNDYNKRISQSLIENSCNLLARVLAEIVYQSCTADYDFSVLTARTLLTTGNRFARCDLSRTWNTGNFGPDAIAFSVNRSGVAIAGVTVYSGSGTYQYQLELLCDDSHTTEYKGHTQHRWETLETVSGSYGQDMVQNNVTDLKFDRPVQIKENVRYSIRLCSQGARTCSGDSGLATLRGPCGTTFSFFPCDLSFNGTSPARGQLPCILYYSTPLRNEGQTGKILNEIHARDTALQIASDIVKKSVELLVLARNILAASNSPSDKSPNSFNNGPTIDSEHNITPIEEHVDVNWTNTAGHNAEAHQSTTRDLTKKIETFSKGLIDTLKFDKRSTNPFDLEIEIGATEVSSTDLIDGDKHDDEKRKECPLRRDEAGSSYDQSDSDENAVHMNNRKILEIFGQNDASLFHTLLPLVFAHISPLVNSDPKSSVQILCLIREILPHIAALNQLFITKDLDNEPANGKFESNEFLQNTSRRDPGEISFKKIDDAVPSVTNLATTSNHYCVVESDHPYRSASISSYKLEFPPCVQWSVIEFDPQCGTGQPEDVLLVSIPIQSNRIAENCHSNIFSSLIEENVDSPCVDNFDQIKNQYKLTSSFVSTLDGGDDYKLPDDEDWIIIKQYSSNSIWSPSSIVLPGNKIRFSLETSSNYLRDQAMNKYGFKCQVIGYDNPCLYKCPNFSLIRIEHELAYLGGMCSANLMKKDLILPDDKLDEVSTIEETFNVHSHLLSKGLALPESVLTINQALSSHLPVGDQSNERQFLKDFVSGAPGSSGARLAAWLQPESRLDTNRCELKPIQEPVRCGWPTQLVVLTRDQYGDNVYVPDLKIEVKAIPSGAVVNGSRKMHRVSLSAEPQALGGLPPPPKSNYEPTIKEKMCFKAITFMKSYQQYSFEELRYCSPVQTRVSETLFAHHLGDGTFGVSWTPNVIGNYCLTITIDAIPLEEIYRVDVKDAGIPPPQKTATRITQPPNKLRRFQMKNSSGLRIRSHPTLQSEEVGIVRLNGVISFIDEIENDDGVWVRLSTESIRQHCTTGWYPTEAWCLQYNQHIGKTLLHPLIDVKDAMRKKRSDSVSSVEQITESPAKGKPNSPSAKAFDFSTSKFTPPLSSDNGTSTSNPFVFTSTSIKMDKTADSEESTTNQSESNLELVTNGGSLNLFEFQRPSTSRDIESKKLAHQTSVDLMSQSQNQTNQIQSTIASVVGGGASKLQALHKWFKGDNIEGGRELVKRKSDLPELSSVSVKDLVRVVSGSDGRSNGNNGTLSSQSSSSPQPIPLIDKPHLNAQPVGNSPRSLSELSDSVSLPGSSEICLSPAPDAGQKSATKSNSDSGEFGVVNTSFQSGNFSVGSGSEQFTGFGRNDGSPKMSPRKFRTKRAISPAQFSSSSRDKNVDTRNPPNVFDSTDMVNSSNEKLWSKSPKKNSFVQTCCEDETAKDDDAAVAGPPKRALPPSLAESLRAVFAAFLWHEGIVHDAMACASFLKFHPNLPKKGELVEKRAEPEENKTLLTREQKQLARHSVEVANAGNYLNIRPSTLETLTKCGNSSVFNRRYRRNGGDGESSTSPEKSKLHALPEVVTVLPPALRCLVYLWEELCSNCVHIVQSTTLESAKDSVGIPIRPPRSHRELTTDIFEKDTKKVRKKKKEDGSWCELCELFLPLSVTYHMRIVHPGCGKPAKGKGYNSVGAFCEGWAGNCGEGGKGASSWYLMCDKCREKFMQGRKIVYNINSINTNMNISPPIKLAKTNLFGLSSSAIFNTEAYTIMKENALFLLELSSNHANSVLVQPKKSSPQHMSAVPESQMQSMFSDSNRPSTSRGNGNNCPTTSGSKENATRPNGRYNNGVLTSTPYRHGNNLLSVCVSPDLIWPAPELFSCLEFLGASLTSDSPYEIFGINSAENGLDRPLSEISLNSIDPNALEMMGGSSSQAYTLSRFHRSLSMGQGWAGHQMALGNNGFPNKFGGGQQFAELTQLDQGNRVVLRRRNNSTCDDTGALLLCYPSSNLRKLVPDNIINTSTIVSCAPANDVNEKQTLVGDSAKKNTQSTVAVVARTEVAGASGDSSQLPERDVDEEKGVAAVDSNASMCLLSRPAIAFILQHHDLDKLKVAMKRSLRVATCRIYSLQALNWLTRSVTQTLCLHDLMWWFVAALTTPSGPTDDNQLKSEEMEYGLEHPVSSIQMSGRVSQLLSQSLHGYLQTIADLTLLLPAGSPLQQISIQCFGIKFRQGDHQFLHRSHVFSNISKILSKSEEQSDDMLATSSAAMQESFHFGNLFPEAEAKVSALVDMNGLFELTVSSRPAMAGSLVDNSTESFWESDEEDRNKPKVVEISLTRMGSVCKTINIHVDNSRDLANKVASIMIFGGQSQGETNLLATIEVDPKSANWLSTDVRDSSLTHFRLEFRGPENNLRVRQIKLMGYYGDEKSFLLGSKSHYKQTNAVSIQRGNCEAETLRVFRLITGQVFGKLILNTEHNRNVENVNTAAPMMEASATSLLADSLDMREHMVGILFSRSKLSHLQKQVIVHIVRAIKKEAQRAKEEWEISNVTLATNFQQGLTSDQRSETSSEHSRTPDTYCFEMLSMVLALSGSSVGTSYLSHQHGLLRDLLSLLHTGSDRVQRQVTALLRRMLPEISPDSLGDLLGVQKMPPADFSIVDQSAYDFDMNRLGIIDIFLSVIAKSLQLQVKVKASSTNPSKNPPTVKLCNCIDFNVHNLKRNKPDGNEARGFVVDEIAPEESRPIKASWREKSIAVAKDELLTGDEKYDNCFEIKRPSKSGDVVGRNLNQRWFLKGSISVKQSENIIGLIKDMSSGKLTDKWMLITKAAIAESIINLTRLDEVFRTPENCIKTATLWLALASLCVLDKDHVDRLSSGQWSKTTETRPFCFNHDDGVTLAIIQCDNCGSLCNNCDKYLHLNKRTRCHQRTVCKEEEEAIRVELHESCGRTKLFWLLALADSKTLKGMVEFRDGNNTIISGPPHSVGRCRYCGITGNSGLLAIGNVCADSQCQEYAAIACAKMRPCGHPCGGVSNETKCLPCLHHACHTRENELAERSAEPKLTQDADDMCMICFTEAVSCAPAIQLTCGHVFHYHCTQAVLIKRWSGPRISFGFCQCPICKADISHQLLEDVLEPINTLKKDVKRKALMRLEYEGVKTNDHRDLATYAMDHYAYYVCFKCQKAYYGGEARCDAEMGDKYDPEELVCGACSDVTKAQMCPKHGTDFLEYKCRYCCSVAVFFCFGTTHFCDTCHDDFQRLSNIPKTKLPQCPAGPKAKQLLGDDCPLHVIHPPTGEEFALGCGICRNAHTF